MNAKAATRIIKITSSSALILYSSFGIIWLATAYYELAEDEGMSAIAFGRDLPPSVFAITYFIILLASSYLLITSLRKK